MNKYTNPYTNTPTHNIHTDPQTQSLETNTPTHLQTQKSICKIQLHQLIYKHININPYTNTPTHQPHTKFIFNIHLNTQYAYFLLINISLPPFSSNIILLSADSSATMLVWLRQQLNQHMQFNSISTPKNKISTTTEKMYNIYTNIFFITHDHKPPHPPPSHPTSKQHPLPHPNHKGFFKKGWLLVRHTSKNFGEGPTKPHPLRSR